MRAVCRGQGESAGNTGGDGKGNGAALSVRHVPTVARRRQDRIGQERSRGWVEEGNGRAQAPPQSGILFQPTQTERKRLHNEVAARHDLVAAHDLMA